MQTDMISPKHTCKECTEV